MTQKNRNYDTLLRAVLSSVMLAIALSPVAAHADDAAGPFDDRVLGDLGGERQRLSDAGMDVTVEYTGDLWDVPSGGIKRGANSLDNLDLKLAMDGEKLFGIAGNNSFLYFINDDGGKPNLSRIGGVQGIDNIEVNKNAFRLGEAWTDQSFFSGALFVLAGVRDLNDEFDSTDMTTNFIQPTFQLGQTVAGSGRNGPSTFPYNAPVIRALAKPSDDTYVNMAAFDGLPGSLNDPGSTFSLHLRPSDGLLLIGEAGFTPKIPDQGDNNPDKLALGAWTYSKAMRDLDQSATSGRMAGAYFISSYRFYHDKDAGHDIGAFLRTGFADGDTSRTHWDFTTGLVANGWLPDRPDGEIGVGFSQAHNSDAYMRAAAGNADRNELGLELYYRDKVAKGISLQPDLQYIVNPGTNLTAKNATAIGLRVDINL